MKFPRAGVFGGFGAAILVTMALSIGAYRQMRIIKATAIRITGDTMPSIYLSGQLQSITLLRYSLLTDYVDRADETENAGLVGKIDSADAQIDGLMSRYEGLIDDPADIQLFKALKAARKPYDECFVRVLSLRREGKRDEALQLTEAELIPLRNAFLKAAEAEAVWNKANADESANAIDTAVSWTSTGLLLALALISGTVFIVLGIRKRLRIERTLRESEERFSEVFECGPVGMYLAGPDERLIQVNAAFCKMLGYSEQELLGKSWPDLCPPENSTDPVEVRQLLQTGTVGRAAMERCYVHRNGAMVWCDQRISLLRGSDGCPRYSVVHAEDITERRRAEEILRESEERFRTFADACPSILWVTNACGESEFVNKAYQEFFGAARDEIQSGKWHLLIHPDDAPAYNAAFERATRERGRFRAEFRVQRADGEWRTIGTRAEARLSPAGEYMGHIGLSADITERLKTEHEHQFQHSLISAIYESSVDGILVINSDNVVVSHNKRFLDVWKIALPAIPGKPPGDISGSLQQPVLSAVLDKVKDPEAYVRQGQALQNDAGEADRSEIELKDGRTIERYAIGLQSKDGQSLGRARFFRDITERKLVLQALQSSEEKFRQLAENIQVVFFVTTPTGGDLLYVSPAYEEVWGRSVDSLYQHPMSWAEAIHPDDQEKVALLAARQFQGERVTSEFRIRTPDGAERWVRNRTAPILNQAGELIRIVGITENITEQKQALQALQDSEEKFRQLTENIREVFWMMNAAGTEMHYISHAYEQIWGRTCESLYQSPMDWLEAIHPEDRERAHETFLRQLHEENIDSEYRIQTPDGQEKWIRDRAFPVRDQSGQLIRIAGIAEEITERKRVERTLRSSEERFRQLAENIREVFRIMPIAGDENLYVSPAFEQIWGKSLESIYRNPASWQDVVHPDDRERSGFLAMRQMQGEPVEVEYRIQTPDGQEKWIRDRAFPVRDQAGELIRVVGIAEEITERKHYEEELIRAREQADAANVAKSRFLANMSHEIRTPMNGVIGMNQLLLDTELNAEQRRYVEVAQTSGKALLAIIDDILDLSKIEAGKVVLEQRSLDLNRTIQDVLHPLRVQATAKGLKLEAHVSANIPNLLCGDAHRLRQVLMNLIGNAIKFTQQGKIAVSADLDSLRGQMATVRFAVADSGIGMRPDQLETVFAPFVQADTSTTRKYGGTGLGLAISKQIVELMGGAIGVDSREGQGSTFWFTAVFQQGVSAESQCGDQRQENTVDASRRATPHAGHRETGHGERILVAEDNSTNREVILAQLKKMGYRGDAVFNGAEAVEALRQRNYSLVLMDCQMPVMDGYEATRQIRDSFLRHIPIIALTASAMSSDRNRCIEEGMDDYLSKPLDFPKLAEMLSKWIPLSGSEQFAEPLPANNAGPSATVFDADCLLLRLMNDRELAGSILDGFLQDAPSQLRQLRARLDDEDAAGVRLQAHTLRGAAATVSAEALSQIAMAMETAAAAGLLNDCRGLLVHVIEEFERFKTAVDLDEWVLQEPDNSGNKEITDVQS